jgi:hypothetical protein
LWVSLERREIHRENLKEKDDLGSLDGDRRIILKWDFKQDGISRTGESRSR